MISDSQKEELEKVIAEAGIEDIVNGSRLLSTECDDRKFLEVLKVTIDKIQSAHQFEKNSRSSVELDSYTQLELYNRLRSVILGFKSAFQKTKGRFEQLAESETTNDMLIKPANALIPQLEALGLLSTK